MEASPQVVAGCGVTARQRAKPVLGGGTPVALGIVLCAARFAVLANAVRDVLYSVLVQTVELSPYLPWRDGDTLWSRTKLAVREGLVVSLLEVRDLQVNFPTADGVVRAVRGVSFDVDSGKTLGIVGESGSGKTVLTQTLLGLTAGGEVSGHAVTGPI
jgi:ABC-type multidrug transport system fused ATPase/permease subunit